MCFLFTITNRRVCYLVQVMQAEAYFKVGNEGSYITLPLLVKTIHLYCRINASLTAFPA